MTHVALRTLNNLALCAGVGMLDEGVRLACEHLGLGFRTVCYVEREAAAASQLVTLMEAGCIDQAPIWSDLCTFDTQRWRGCVDSITAGFPCQPHSVAGKREGLEDERWIWPEITGLIGDLRPKFVFLENVPGLVVTGGLDAVIADLARLGMHAEWGRLSAADVGGSHERERLFILAWLADAGREHGLIQQWRVRPEHPRSSARVANAGSGQLLQPRRGSEGRDGSRPTSADMGDAERARRTSTWCGYQKHARRELEPGCSAVANTGRECAEWRKQVELPGGASAPATVGHSEGVANTDSVRSERIGRPGQAGTPECSDGVAKPNGERLPEPEFTELFGARWRTERGAAGELCGAFAPGPSDPLWQHILVYWPFLDPAIEPGVCVLADGLAMVVDESRTDQLRAIGNGVVALTAACAYVELARRAGCFDVTYPSTNHQESVA